MSLFCIAEKLCEQFDIIDQLCAKNDELASNNEAICDKIEQLVGDPDGECPECPEATPLVEEAVAQTAAIKEVTATVAVKTLAVKTALTRTAKKEA